MVESDHSVAPPLAAVDDGGLARFLIDEQIEVVTDQLHPIERLFDADRRGREGLLPQHHRRVAFGLQPPVRPVDVLRLLLRRRLVVGRGDHRTRHGHMDHPRSGGPLPTSLAPARSSAAYLSLAMASARIAGPFATTVSSTRSLVSGWREFFS